MGSDDLKRKIIEEYMVSASPEERDELKKLLGGGSKTPGMSGLNVDVSQIAKNMSKQINKQLGMADINIKKMAKDLVVQMALQHKPDITRKELYAIVDRMVPDRKSSLNNRIPAGMMRSMIVQFISYSTGIMPESEKRCLPSGWEKKYWETFPDDIKYLISAFLKKGLDSGSFWSGVDRILGNKQKGR